MLYNLFSFLCHNPVITFSIITLVVMYILSLVIKEKESF